MLWKTHLTDEGLAWEGSKLASLKPTLPKRLEIANLQAFANAWAFYNKNMFKSCDFVTQRKKCKTLGVKFKGTDGVPE